MLKGKESSRKEKKKKIMKVLNYNKNLKILNKKVIKSKKETNITTDFLLAECQT